jgi:accessory gene regulator protein AgrB
LDELKASNDQLLKSGGLDLGGTVLSYASGDNKEVSLVTPEVEAKKKENTFMIIMLIIFGVIA